MGKKWASNGKSVEPHLWRRTGAQAHNGWWHVPNTSTQRHTMSSLLLSPSQAFAVFVYCTSVPFTRGQSWHQVSFHSIHPAPNQPAPSLARNSETTSPWPAVGMNIPRGGVFKNYAFLPLTPKTQSRRTWQGGTYFKVTVLGEYETQNISCKENG